MTSKSMVFDEGDVALAKVLVKAAKRHLQDVEPMLLELAKESGRRTRDQRLIIEVSDEPGTVLVPKFEHQPSVRFPGIGH